MSLALIYFALYAFVFIFGCLMGSFLNVVVYRVPLKISVVKGRSFCPNCGKKIAAYDNIPLMSYIWLRGKCRKCGSKIAPRYFITELAGGFLALLMVLHYDFGVGAIVGFAVGILLLGIALIDLDTMTIPNGLIITLIIPVAASYFAFLNPDIISRVIGIFVVSVPMFVLTLIIPGGFGGGDIKLMAVAGFLLGWPYTLLAAFIGILLGGIVAAFKLIRKDKEKHMAFGPYLCMGITISLLWGMDIIFWYLDLFGL
ncbi:MAG: prepilin peptidase [Eubacterium sp.]